MPPEITTDAALEALQEVCAEVRPARADDVVDGVAARLVAAPATTAEAAAAIRVATEHRLAVVPRGNGTKLTWGNPPERVDLLVDTSQLSGVVEHAAGDLVVVVRAGTPLATLQQALAPAGQRLALDETVPGSTIGGVIATATSGPRRVLSGSVRDLLIGITVVRPDGVVAKAGGKVVKNVAGYDLGKLFTGSYGTLGLITEAAFRLHPIPAAASWITVVAADPDAAGSLVQATIQSQVVPSAVEIDWPAGGPGELSVLLEGTRAGVEGRTDTLQGLLGPGATARPEPPAWWGTYPTGAQRGPRDVLLKITYAISGLPSVLRSVDEVSHAAGLPLTVRGSAGAGVVYAGLPTGAGLEAVRSLLARLRDTCAALGGSVVVVDAPPSLKAAVDVWGPVPALGLMRRVKDQFDPDHRFAAGRFVGGI